MKGIGGNVTAIIQTSETAANEIGEQVQHWTDAATLSGWLDLSGGDSKYSKTIVCPDGCVIFRLTAEPTGRENFYEGHFCEG